MLAAPSAANTNSVRPDSRLMRHRHHHRSKLRIRAQHRDRIRQDRRRLPQQRIRPLLGRLFLRHLLGDIALVGLQAVVVLAAALALTASGCAEETADPGAGGDGATGSAGGGDESGPVKMGVVLDITGAGASLGVAERETIELLAEQVNDEGGIGGRELEVIIEDNQSTEDGAAKATNKLLTTDEVHILLGASRTGPSLAMRPLAEQAEIPMVSLAANQKIVDGSEWVFKTAQNDRVVLEKMVDDMAAKGYTKVAVARDASGFGEGIPEMLTEIGSDAGIEVTAVEKFAPDATDFTAQLRDALGERWRGASLTGPARTA